MGKKSARNIILIGFSYTGKTTVGKEVALKLGWSFVDTDDEIALLAGKTVPEIFAQDGEARFREMERTALDNICQSEKMVVATGGGAVIDAANRELILQNGVVICLEATPATIYQRLLNDDAAKQNSIVRPLLAGNEPLKLIKSLKLSRQHYYTICDWTVNTDHITEDEVVEEVIRGFEYLRRAQAVAPIPNSTQASDTSYSDSVDIATVVTTATGSYPVFVGWDLLDRLGMYMRSAGINGRAYIVSDDQVFPIYGTRVKTLLEEDGFTVDCLAVPQGEHSKSLETAGSIYDWLVKNRCERGDSIVALGGGVVGDLTGFIAATFLRGIPLVQVPTTLVGMVDSSIGGKTAINHPQAKNLIGAFYQPRLVLSDIHALTTLSQRELVSGWAEVIKHAMILDADLAKLLEGQYQKLLKLDEDITSKVVTQNAAIKARVITEDEKDTGIRTILNYGHTIAHGLEAATGYGYFLHGEAVSIGIMGAALISEQIGLLSPDVVRRQQDLLDNFGLPTTCSGVKITSVLKAMELDKKVRGKALRWVLLTDVGQTVIREDVSPEVLMNVLKVLLKSK
ncbi:3-dehydroquinate synthase [Chloroflexota bacterium]